MNDAQKRKEHYEKYKDLPIEQIPNFNLKRPLTPDELDELKLVAMCERDDEIDRNAWLRLIILTGNVENFLKMAQEARKFRFYERRETKMIDGRITDTTPYLVIFPPVIER